VDVKQMNGDVFRAPTLVLGGTGKTGSRLAQTLTRLGVPVRAGSRSAEVPFDWSPPHRCPATWPSS
jgi:hypothetical protein